MKLNQPRATSPEPIPNDTSSKINPPDLHRKDQLLVSSLLKGPPQASLRRRPPFPVEIISKGHKPHPADNYSLDHFKTFAKTNSQFTYPAGVKSLRRSLTSVGRLGGDSPLRSFGLQPAFPPITECLKGIEGLRGHELHKKLTQIVDDELLRGQATSLKGNDAVVLSDVIHKVPLFHLPFCEVACTETL